MNCRDIARLLIGVGVRRLTEAELADVKLHLASCHDCASDWEVHARLLATPVPEMPAGLAARCRAAVAASPGLGGGKRKSNPYILLGMALALAAAAAMLVWPLSGRPDRPVAAPAQSAVAVTTEPHSGEPGSEAGVPGGSDAAAVADSISAESDAAQARPALAFTVMVMPLVQEAKDPVLQASIEKHYAALLEQLRAVPQLILVNPDPPGKTAQAKPDFQITITGNQPPRGASREFRGQWNALLLAYARQKGGDWDVVLSNSYSGNIDTVCAPHMPPGPECRDPAGIAAEQIESLRLQAFPPDPSILRELHAQVRDPALSFSARQAALTRLLRQTGERKTANWDATSIRAVVELIAQAPDSRTRAQIWGMLRGVRHPDLLQPLLAQLEKETDDGQRLELLTTLIEDFGATPAARAALERLRNDSRQSVRLLTERALSSDATWRSSVLGTLMNADLTDEMRVEPLVQILKTMKSADVEPFLDNAEVLTQLAQLLPRIWNRPRDTSAPLSDATLLVFALGKVQHATAVDLLLEALRTSQDQMVRVYAAVGLGQWHLGDRRVRSALEEVAKDPDPKIRAAAQLALRLDDASGPQTRPQAQ